MEIIREIWRLCLPTEEITTQSTISTHINYYSGVRVQTGADSAEDNGGRYAMRQYR